ncbi:hypothetical protein OG225_42930 (plasmid) [Nocardia sp. NBC_01377]
MPKNRSARRRRRTRRTADATGLTFTAAQRLGDVRAATHDSDSDSSLRPGKIQIDGAWRYLRRSDAQISQDELSDPTNIEVVATADAALSRVRALMSARLRPVTVPVPDGQPRRVIQCTDLERFRTTVREVFDDLARIREDADIAHVDWRTVANAVSVDSKLGELRRITDGTLRDALETAVTATEILATTCEAVHSLGCLLGAGENRTRRGGSYSPCGGGDIRVRVRIYDDETTVTDPGCPRHAAEEITCRDFEVEAGDVGVEILGGTDEDLDLVFEIADLVRCEREQRWHARENDMTAVAETISPPWMQREHQW